MNLGNFSVSLAVKDLAASHAFYDKLGFVVIGGDASQNWLILRNGTVIVGLFQGMFERNPTSPTCVNCSAACVHSRRCSAPPAASANPARPWRALGPTVAHSRAQFAHHRARHRVEAQRGHGAPASRAIFAWGPCACGAQRRAQHLGDLAQLHEAARRDEALAGHARRRQGAHMQVGHVAHVDHAEADVGAGAHAAVQQLLHHHRPMPNSRGSTPAPAPPTGQMLQNSRPPPSRATQSRAARSATVLLWM
jgi:hypothetical protein